MNKITKHLNNKKLLSIFLLAFLAGTCFLMLPNQFNSNEEIGSKNTELNDDVIEEFNDLNELTTASTNPKSVNLNRRNIEYDVSLWWNKTYRYRKAIELENQSIDIYKPVDVFLSFKQDEHYEHTTRLVRFNATGNDEWDKTPVEVWNITKYSSTDYIESCTISFIANISKEANSTYFVYYNDDMENIEMMPEYDNFSPLETNYDGNKVSVSVNPSSDFSAYTIEFEKGSAVNNMTIDDISNKRNRHLNQTFRPEKLIDQLSFLVHMDENSGTTLEDSTGNEEAGLFGEEEHPGNDPDSGNPTWTNGRINYGLKFNRDERDIVAFTGNSGDPLPTVLGPPSDSFTVTAWIKPTSLSDEETNHQTPNPFLCKSSDDDNDNIELGISLDGYLHVYIDCNDPDSEKDTQARYGGGENNIVIKQNEWNFIAVTYNQGDVDVYIYNDDTNQGDWFLSARTPTYPAEPWSGSTDIDDAPSYLTLGGSQHGDPDVSEYPFGGGDYGDLFYDGYMDEVAIYNVTLSQDEIENYKLSSYHAEIDTIEEIVSGNVMARYEVNWTQTFDMHTRDIFTFYYDYNLWNIHRTIWFETSYDGDDPTESTMNALNAYYNLTSYNLWDDAYLAYDGNIISDISTVNNKIEVENYSIFCDPGEQYETSGIFVAKKIDPDPDSSFSYINGTAVFNDDDPKYYLEYAPGAINDFDNADLGSNGRLILDFWEFINQTKFTSNQELETILNNTYDTLKTDIDAYIYNRSLISYNLQVNLTDIDGNVVPEATVTVWNASNPLVNWSQNTNTQGLTTFTDLENGTYMINATYEKYINPIEIITPVEVTLNDTYVDSTGLNKTEITNVNITTLELSLQRVIDQGGGQYDLADDPSIDGALVSFYIDSGLGYEKIGNETSASSSVTFRWRNFTKATDGKIKFNITFLDDKRTINATKDLTGPYDTEVEWYFLNYTQLTVNVSLEDYSSSLISSSYNEQILGDIYQFEVRYSYTYGGTQYNIDGAKVNYYVKKSGVNISSTIISFSGQGDGLYTTTIDTDDPVDPDIRFQAGETYSLIVKASKDGFTPETELITFTPQEIPSTLSLDKSSISVYWGQSFSLEATYTNTYADPDILLNDSDVRYYCVQRPEINGSFTPTGNDGEYSITLDSEEFIYHGTYDLEITAQKQNYTDLSTTIPINIDPINTQINNSISLRKTIKLEVGLEKIFKFNYTRAGTTSGIASAVTAECEWEQVNQTGTIVESGIIALQDLGGGDYQLDLDTQYLNISTYNLVVSIGQTNYVERTAFISLEIIPRSFGVSLSDEFEENIINIYSGDPLDFDMTVRDLTNNTLLANASATLTLQGKTYGFSYSSGGVYSIDITDYTTPGKNETSTTNAATITISKANFSTEVVSITVVINNRQANYTLKGEFTGNKLTVVSGKDLAFDLELYDSNTQSGVENASITLKIDGEEYDDVNITYQGDGVYHIEFLSYPNAFFTGRSLSGEIVVQRDNYKTQSIPITIQIEMNEILGFPTFYSLMILIGIGAVAGSLATYRYIQLARIPEFVKRSRAMSKDIKAGKAIDKTLLYPSKEEFMAMELADRWEAIGLSLPEILGVEMEKKPIKEKKPSKDIKTKEPTEEIETKTPESEPKSESEPDSEPETEEGGAE